MSWDDRVRQNLDFYLVRPGDVDQEASWVPGNIRNRSRVNGLQIHNDLHGFSRGQASDMTNRQYGAMTRHIGQNQYLVNASREVRGGHFERVRARNLLTWMQARVRGNQVRARLQQNDYIDRRMHNATWRTDRAAEAVLFPYKRRRDDNDWI